MAGIVTKQDLKNVSGTPYLGEIPFFKYFFSSQSKEVQTDEIVFLLIPHIVRESVLTKANLLAIDTGTLGDIELRTTTDAKESADVDKPVITAPPPTANPSSAANAAAAAMQQMNQQAQPATPGVAGAAFTAPGALPTAMPKPDAPSGAFAAPVALSIGPSGLLAKVGQTVQLSVSLQNGQDIFSVPMQLQFNPRVLQLVNVDAGDLLQRDGKPATVVHRDDGNGQVTIGATRPPQATGVTGSGNVCNLTFRAVGVGDSTVSFVKVGAKNSAQVAIAATGTPASVHVQ
jgi:general secretion pathway protein D